MYTQTSFERRPLQDILQDIEAAAKYYGSNAPTVFIGDSNSLVLGAGTLEKILNHVYQNFPHLRRLTSYARARTLCKKPLADLKRIRAAGLTRLHIGLETGDPELLDEISKGATPDQMISGCLRAKEAGFEVSLYVLAGIGGEQKWQAHAEGTAAVLNQINPHFIRIRTFVPRPLSPLWEAVQASEFELAAPDTILKEQRRLIECLEVASEYLSDHVSNYLPLNGTLPEDKARLLETVDAALKELAKDARYRRSLEMKRHLTRL
jgi:radical SAM superfamily enzyme YgiQ (UPF0313 family)